VSAQTLEKQRTAAGDITAVPRHVAVIMDGNGRWARERGLPRIKGHEAGAESVAACVRSCRELGIENLTLFAFSTENWKRPREEVDALMRLLRRFLDERARELDENNVRLGVIGRIHELPESTREAIDREVARTAVNTGGRLTLALNYSGRSDILDAVKRIAEHARDGKLDPNAIDEELISNYLYTRELPDPDLLIRSSGEMRISNFMLWQLSYTEIHVTNKLWPDFREADMRDAVRDYSMRHRRYGAI
jgi:undecaprenyl diphosphate synthase